MIQHPTRRVIRLGLPAAGLALLVGSLSGCSSNHGSGVTGAAVASSSTGTPPGQPITVSRGNLRLISADLQTPAGSNAVYLDATIDNINPTAVQLVGVTFTAAGLNAASFAPVDVPGYEHTSLTGAHRLRVGTADTPLRRGERITVTLRFVGAPSVQVALPVE